MANRREASSMEWLLFCVLMALALLPLLRLMPRLRLPLWPYAIVIGGGSLTLAAAVFWNHQTHARLAVDREFFQSIPRQGRPGGYISSDKCAACHPNQYTTWHRTFHRTMTQYATPTSVVGRFDGVDLSLLGQTYRLERRGNEFWVDLPDPEWRTDSPSSASALGGAPRVQRRIGLLTGSHRMQAYWIPSRYGNMQIVFPFVWLISDRRWVPLRDSFLRDPNIPPSQHIWNVNCLKCHATAGQPRPDPQTRILDTQVGELGIACEACHGPGEEHVRANHNPLRRYWLHRGNKPDPTIVNPARCAQKLSAQICGQCHGIKWIPAAEPWEEYGFTYRPGEDMEQTTPMVRPARLDQQPWLKEPLRRDPSFLEQHYWSDGMVRVSGRDYNGLIESPCYQRGNMTCLSCHSMHQSAPDAQVAARMTSNEACLQCHAAFRKKIAEHSHHQPGSTGTECYNCHMPFTTYGLMKAIRSHQITSPTVQSSLQTGRPNACNLCHLDKSLDWTARYLKDWYGTTRPQLDMENRTISAALLWLLRGDAGQRALIAWHMGWGPARQASGQRWLAPFLAQLLEDPYATVRYIAHRSLRQLAGFNDFEFDFVGPEPDRARARQRALEIWTRVAPASLDRSGAEVLIGSNGALQTATLERLLRQRDDHSIDLQE
ncbi:MAG: multiheme c-type cytochrome [Limisphaerales bacterium]